MISRPPIHQWLMPMRKCRGHVPRQAKIHRNSAAGLDRLQAERVNAVTEFRRFDFSGAHVLVVGASRAGIGAAMVRAFQDAGATVAITGAELEPVAEDRARFVYSQFDVTDHAAVRALAAETDRLDVLVNCAAITSRGEETAPALFERVVDVNPFGTFRTAAALDAHLNAQKGVPINIASMYATFGSPRNPAYGASKAAVAQLTKSLAIAWAPDVIRVSAVGPDLL